jgi:L-iditol 2-dehydrogenase
MQALILNDTGKPDLADEAMPDCGADEVLVQIRACVLSHRDLDLYAGNQTGQAGLSRRLGQGLTGIVASTGSKVDAVAPGDRVLVCRMDVGFTEYLSVPAHQVVVLPADISYEEGAIALRLSSVLYGLEQAQVEHKTIFISGAGSTGLLCAQVARLFGVSKIIMSDLHALRLRRAMDLAADTGINASTEDVNWRILDETGGQGVEVSIECASTELSFRQCEACLRPYGMLIMLGAMQQPMTIDMDDWSARSLRLAMGREQPQDTRPFVERGLRLVESGAVRLRPLLTHVFPIHRAKEAFDLIQEDPNRSVKVALTQGPSPRTPY